MAEPQMAVEDALLRSMASNTSYLKEFPILGALRVPVKGTGRCGKCGHSNRQTNTLRGIKEAMAMLPQPKLDKLKKMLGAEKLLFRYKDRRDQSVTLLR